MNADPSPVRDFLCLASALTPPVYCVETTPGRGSDWIGKASIPSRVFGLRGFKHIKKSRKNRVFVISRSENGRAEPWILLSPPKESKREMSGSSAKNFPRRKIGGMLWGRFEMETKEQGGSHTGRGSAFDTNLLFQEADTSRLPT